MFLSDKDSGYNGDDHIDGKGDTTDIEFGGIERREENHEKRKQAKNQGKTENQAYTGFFH